MQPCSCLCVLWPTLPTADKQGLLPANLININYNKINDSECCLSSITPSMWLYISFQAVQSFHHHSESSHRSCKPVFKEGQRSFRLEDPAVWNYLLSSPLLNAMLQLNVQSSWPFSADDSWASFWAPVVVSQQTITTDRSKSRILSTETPDTPLGFGGRWGRWASVQEGAFSQPCCVVVWMKLRSCPCYGAHKRPFGCFLSSTDVTKRWFNMSLCWGELCEHLVAGSSSGLQSDMNKHMLNKPVEWRGDMFVTDKLCTERELCDWTVKSINGFFWPLEGSATSGKHCIYIISNYKVHAHPADAD